MYLSETHEKKWQPVLEHPDLPKITDAYRRAVTSVILENQERASKEDSAYLAEAAPTNATGSAVANWDPILISLVRRAMPNLIAYDIAGVQPMTGPTGLIFAMKARYGAGATSSTEALFNEAETARSGDSSVTENSNPSGLSGISGTAGDASGDSSLDSERVTGGTAGGMSTADAEGLGSGGSTDPNSSFTEMGFTIEKATVTAKSRALKAEYSLELAQDLKAIHGLDAETELANILSTEILAEVNREVVRTINSQAKTGCLQSSTALNGIFNMSTDADGRWSVEKFKGLIVQIERESNVIAKETRRGKGNYVICSSDVASVLAASGMLDYSPALSTSLNVDDTGNTFAGVLNGKFKVYVDPYSANVSASQFYVAGYKGTSPYDAGLFYCPYVPLQMVRAVGQDSFQPKIGFKTRYGMVQNPFATTNGLGALDVAGAVAAGDQNAYYRRVKVSNIM